MAFFVEPHALLGQLLLDFMSLRWGLMLSVRECFSTNFFSRYYRFCPYLKTEAPLEAACSKCPYVISYFNDLGDRGFCCVYSTLSMYYTRQFVTGRE